MHVDLAAPWSFYESRSVKCGDKLAIRARFRHRETGAERVIEFTTPWSLDGPDPHFLAICAILNSRRDPAEFEGFVVNREG